MPLKFDVIIIGSGFGGSVSAMRLTEKGYRVAVLEAGRRWRTEDFPKTNWNTRKSLWFPKLGMHGIQRMSLLPDIMVLSGAGVGGGSLVYANTLYEPLDPFYSDDQWGAITDWKKELALHFLSARHMLGATENPLDTPADEVMRRVAGKLGVGDTFHPTDVGVFFGEAGVDIEDPYFGGEGPARAGCIACGNCMVGCRHNAKNTLDKNYLYFAEQRGASVFPSQQVVDVERSNSRWLVTARKPGAWFARSGTTYEADHVIFSAGALGSTRLLLELQERGRLPRLSHRIGYQTRTNSEAIVGAVAKNRKVDYSRGIAITSSIHPTPDTHIEPVRYGPGSNALGLLGVLLTDGGDGMPRQLRFAANIARHPVAFLRSLSVWHWSERSIILLVMQTKDNSIRLLRKKGWFRTRLSSTQGEGEPNPSYIPIANDIARATAAEIDGVGFSSFNEVLFDTPTTAHILGGAPVGATPDTGVIDAYHRVFGHAGLHVIDGAAIGANLGVNPALTITAMAERAVSMWPDKGDPDQRPPLGEEYRRPTSHLQGGLASLRARGACEPASLEELRDIEPSSRTNKLVEEGRDLTHETRP
ncbi:MAG: GMC family oxidoreductase [Actinomycetota bacterium]|nr:GMC family oxidoreductase [Actinomycetota bacterium]